MSDDTEEKETKVEENETIVEEIVIERTYKDYQYFDTPNGEDVGKKLWYSVKQVSPIVLAVGTIDVFMYTRTKRILGVLGRYAWTALPVYGVTSAFVLTTNFAKIYREKEDYWNWGMGGMAGGMVMAAYTGRATSGWLWGTIFAAAALFKKNAVDNNWTLIPEGPIPLGTIKYVRHDYSLTPYRSGNYTVGPIGSGASELEDDSLLKCKSD